MVKTLLGCLPMLFFCIWVNYCWNKYDEDQRKMIQEELDKFHNKD